MTKGTIKNWFSKPAYGFANSDEGGPNIFLHISNFAEPTSTDAVRPGTRIEFDTEQGRTKHKDRAINIKILPPRDTRIGEVKTELLERQG